MKHPFIFEINTWVWLDELRARLGKKIGLGDVPAPEWDAIAALGFDAVWLMGVWERSPAGIAVALQNDALTQSFRDALPDVTSADVVGSPYCIRDYTVAQHLGGPKGLESARKALARRGLGLILDFVPNHTRPTTSGQRRTPSTPSRAVTRTWSASRRRSCASATMCSPTDATRSSPPRPTSCR
jgi:hypothetical protein